MNLSLLDPFAVAKEYPEVLTQTLSYGHSTCIKSTRSGDYLASGLIDGTIIIIDNDTNSTISILHDHTRSITSLCWSYCGRYLLSGSRDWKVNLWDLQKGHVIRSVTFEGPVWNCTLVPGSESPFQFVAALLEDDPVFVDMSCANSIKITKLETDPFVDDGDRKHWTLTCAYEKTGRFIFNGTSKGWLNIIDGKSFETVKSIKICNSNIKGIEFSSIGENVAINSSDRIIRQYKLTIAERENGTYKLNLELENRYQDAVNRLQWNSVKFNHNSEYLCASTLGATHDVYIWETGMGSLIKILEGSNEELIEVDWNFRRCCITATGMDSGMLYNWSIVIPQKWSALAPDFEEIEENIDYEEKEDEFDFVDYDDDLNKIIEEEERDIVDVITKEKTDARGFPFVESFVINVSLQPELE
ncbi:hypothetical protein CANARDRAFT_175922 [[Candida] arabinofermentans NRRL YB-2248]|uniref:Uncharacterized protein n=1 Tax=[Candida] arabinofermentans NRRL YB-2248 TaxID=983967 RepID=A0A1E4T156_9ASCO|nr:hypothetical protein CANARDRAFT_175922 [[Candida] arabinofermentans NRRL YB-2248]